MFNTTPGNLRGSRGPFVDFVSSVPYLEGHKRILTAEGLAAEIAAHANHFSSDPSAQLPPVGPSQRLQSSPGPLTIAQQGTSPQVQALSKPQSRTKKARRNTAPEEPKTQTATPPPSARKDERRLAPKVLSDAMQNDHEYGQPDFMAGTPQQHSMGTFATSPGDVFGFPMSATAPAFTGTRPFWEADPNMEAMDIDFAAAGADMFQTSAASHRPMSSLDWGRTNEMFQETGMVVPGPNQENQHPPARGDRPIASKDLMPNIDTSSLGQSMFSDPYPTPIDDPFGIVGGSGGVDPGLLFSRPPSSSMDAASFGISLPLSSSVPAVAQTAPYPPPAEQPAKAPLRRSNSVREPAARKQVDRTLASSPIKPTIRPGLSRSQSENRGARRQVGGRNSFPLLAPAIKPAAPPPSGNPGLPSSRPMSHSAAGRPSGRTSPPKSQNPHRLSSLTSIPEAATPRPRTSVKFTIDANGRARAETTVLTDDDELLEPPSTVRRRSLQPRPLRKAWNSSDEDDGSETDDEPIIIPSRPTSFVLPDPLQAASRPAPFHSSQHSISDRSTTSTYAGYSGGGGGSQHDAESEAETVLDGPTGGKGDAASELQRLKESRLQQKRGSLMMSGGGGHKQRFVYTGAAAAMYRGAATMSPTALTDASLPTPSSDRTRMGVRCVCNVPETGLVGDGFMVQWYV